MNKILIKLVFLQHIKQLLLIQHDISLSELKKKILNIYNFNNDEKDIILKGSNQQILDNDINWCIWLNKNEKKSKLYIFNYLIEYVFVFKIIPKGYYYHVKNAKHYFILIAL